jgi:hypothetical protein
LLAATGRVKVWRISVNMLKSALSMTLKVTPVTMTAKTTAELTRSLKKNPPEM